MLLQTLKEKDLLVLDSFAGSGTTAHAVLDLNKEDNGNRKFILVELKKKICKKLTSQRVKKVINGYKTTGKKTKVPGLGGGFQYYELGVPLLNDNKEIHKDVKFEDLAAYIFNLETQTTLDPKKMKKNFIGSHNGTDYYLFLGSTDKLNEKFLDGLKPNKKVIFAEKCRIDPDIQKKHDMTFRQIPYCLEVI